MNKTLLIVIACIAGGLFIACGGVVLVSFMLMSNLEKAKEDAARVKATEVKHAAQMWMKDHEDAKAPPTAQTLTKSDPALNGVAYLSDEAARDLWGQYYQIEMNNGQVKAFTIHDGKRLESK